MEFVTLDNAFFYTFSSYAGVLPPQRNSDLSRWGLY